MRKYILVLFLLSVSPLFSQTYKISSVSDSIKLAENLRAKILSTKLLDDVQQIRTAIKQNSTQTIEDKISVAIYFESYPTNDQISELEKLGITCFTETWIPPLENHPYGFLLAKMPSSSFEKTLSMAFIKRMDSSTHKSYPKNNNGTAAMYVPQVWAEGYDGAGVKIAILDSGLDPFYEGTDLPSGYARKDYSNYPSLDDDVENQISGHGTHVTGSVLGRGVLSADNTGNGGGPYKGSAPGADLIFLKIGNDSDGSASNDAIVAAIHAAVTDYDAQIISMSYGGWDEYHDGSSQNEQAADWAYSQGVAVFFSAGNEASDALHFSGTVASNSTSDFIQFNISAPLTQPSFNLVWSDGTAHNNLSLYYYRSNQNEITNVIRNTTTESSRGTESQLSGTVLPYGSGTYYLKVDNPSDQTQFYHIYVNTNNVIFTSPDPNYTIGEPASADHAFAVGAFTTRETWEASDGGTYWYGSGVLSVDEICSFSSQGPRIDGLQKPNITAPGAAIISLRDTYVITSFDGGWVDNDGIIGSSPYETDANYYVNAGTSMATPLAAGAAALYLQYFPGATPQEVYDAISNYATTDSYTGSVPNSTYGYGKLNIYNAIFNSQLAVDIKIYMEGAYNSNTHNMTTDLNSNNYISLDQPFNTDPWNYSGSESVDSIPQDVTDWVLVELRSDENTVVSKKVAFVKNDGNVVDLNGYPFKITGVAGQYYIVVFQRNHLPIMSSSKINISSLVTPPMSYANVNLGVHNGLTN